MAIMWDREEWAEDLRRHQEEAGGCPDQVKAAEALSSLRARFDTDSGRMAHGPMRGEW